jgi:hypothetical protein
MAPTRLELRSDFSSIYAKVRTREAGVAMPCALSMR